MTTPMNASLLRAKGFAPSFNGIANDGSVASAHALIGIGEILQQILGELQKQNAQQAQPAQQFTGRKRRTTTNAEDYGF